MVNSAAPGRGGGAGWGPLPTHRALAQAADLAAALVHRVHVHQVVVGAHGQVRPVWGRGRGGYEEAPRLYPLLSQIQPPAIPDCSAVPNSVPARVLDRTLGLATRAPLLPPASDRTSVPRPGFSKIPGPRRLPGEKLTTEICSLPSVWIATRSWVSVSRSSHL